jgi:hypothetical protein
MLRPLLLIISLSLGVVLRAAEPTVEHSAADQQFYTEKVKPLLVKHCYNCHSHAGGEASGELVLDSRNSIIKGGDRGPAIVAGDPSKSLLIKAINYNDSDLQMPEKGKLAQAEIDILTEWVKRGAPWNNDTVVKNSSPAGMMKTRPRGGKLTDADRAYWVFQPVKAVEPPAVADQRWNRHPVDRFVYQKLQENGLMPAPMAEKGALLRRVYQDLIGLPPTLAEYEEFLKDDAPDAYDKVVDRLLASPRYGERWARHWFDVARFAESDGYKIDEFRPTAWRYRDYVINAFNDDKPYDEFVRQQLAGDELEPQNPEAHIATGFLRLGIYEYNNRDAKLQWSGILNEVTDVTGDVFLGVGLQCARCHDHKFDPILQKDYYRLQAFFAPLDWRDRDPLATAQEQTAYQEKLAAWEEKTASIRAEIEAMEAPMRKKQGDKSLKVFPLEIQQILQSDFAKLSPYEQQIYNLAYRQIQYEHDRVESKFKDEEKKKLVELKKQLAEHSALKPELLPTTLTVKDIGPVAPPVMIPKKKDEIAPGFLTLLDAADAKVTAPSPSTTGRRSALANWLTDPQNPLTARVIVNRIWQAHFGRGIVPTTSDFGTLSEKPSHPELLDWLADDFVKHGWRIKRVHRLLVTSETYRQAALVKPSDTALRVDPENRLLWRMPTRRLDAEQIRDAILQATGKLDLKAGGPSVEPSQPRRTIYAKVLRNIRDPLLEVFDTPESYLSTSERNATTTPIQSLLMINSPQLLKHARDFAARMEKEHPSDLNSRVTATYQLLYGRQPTTQELAIAQQFLRVQAKELKPTADPGSNFQYAKMPYREGRAAVLQAGMNGPKLVIPETDKFPTEDFAVEGFIVLRSMFEDASVRTIASQGTGELNRSGWSFGVTSKKSAYKPQVLVLQMWGKNADDKWDYEPVFSNLHIELNKPYFVAVSVDLSHTDKQGVTFFAKDLSNDDEPMQLSRVAHRIVKQPGERGPLALGQVFGAKSERAWDGLIDDVRLSRAALSQEKLLLTQDNPTEQTAGYWQFEMQPGMFHDSSGNGQHMKLDMQMEPIKKKPGEQLTNAAPVAASPSAWVDYCHVLLNASEFLYVD